MRARLNLVLLVLVAVCGGSLWWAGRVQTAAPATVRPAPAAQVPQPARAKESPASEPVDTPIRLVVLNGTGQSGLAGELGQFVNRLGCVVSEVGNAPHGGFSRSVLVNRRLSDKRAAELARSLGRVPVVREFDDRRSEDAVLVLGADAGTVREAAATTAGEMAAARQTPPK